MGNTTISRLIEALECEVEAVKKRGESNVIEALKTQSDGQFDNAGTIMWMWAKTESGQVPFGP